MQDDKKSEHNKNSNVPDEISQKFVKHQNAIENMGFFDVKDMLKEAEYISDLLRNSEKSIALKSPTHHNEHCFLDMAVLEKIVPAAHHTKANNTNIDIKTKGICVDPYMRDPQYMLNIHSLAVVLYLSDLYINNTQESSQNINKKSFKTILKDFAYVENFMNEYNEKEKNEKHMLEYFHNAIFLKNAGRKFIKNLWAEVLKETNTNMFFVMDKSICDAETVFHGRNSSVNIKPSENFLKNNLDKNFGRIVDESLRKISEIEKLEKAFLALYQHPAVSYEISASFSDVLNHAYSRQHPAFVNNIFTATINGKQKILVNIPELYKTTERTSETLFSAEDAKDLFFSEKTIFQHLMNRMFDVAMSESFTTNAAKEKIFDPPSDKFKIMSEECDYELLPIPFIEEISQIFLEPFFMAAQMAVVHGVTKANKKEENDKKEENFTKNSFTKDLLFLQNKRSTLLMLNIVHNCEDNEKFMELAKDMKNVCENFTDQDNRSQRLQKFFDILKPFARYPSTRNYNNGRWIVVDYRDSDDDIFTSIFDDVMSRFQYILSFYDINSVSVAVMLEMFSKFFEHTQCTPEELDEFNKQNT